MGERGRVRELWDRGDRTPPAPLPVREPGRLARFGLDLGATAGCVVAVDSGIDESCSCGGSAAITMDDLRLR